MTHGRNDRSVNGRIGRALGLLAAASLTLGIAQRATAQSSTERVSVDEWSRLVWMNAEAGKSEVVFKLLEALPRNHASTAVTSLRDAVDLRERHIQDREATRVTRMEELRAELAERLDKKEYDKALNSAVELQDLSGDK